jgi:hypothetical protein
MKLTGENRQLGEKPVPVPLCPPQISHGLTRDRTRASAVRGRRLTARAMARPLAFRCLLLLVTEGQIVRRRAHLCSRMKLASVWAFFLNCLWYLVFVNVHISPWPLVRVDWMLCSGLPEEQIELSLNNFDEWIRFLRTRTTCHKIVLQYTKNRFIYLETALTVFSVPPDKLKALYKIGHEPLLPDLSILQ